MCRKVVTEMFPCSQTETARPKCPVIEMAQTETSQTERAETEKSCSVVVWLVFVHERYLFFTEAMNSSKHLHFSCYFRENTNAFAYYLLYYRRATKHMNNQML